MDKNSTTFCPTFIGLFRIAFLLTFKYVFTYFFRLKTFKLCNIMLGSGALPGKMLLVRIIENNIIDAYFRSG